MLFFRVLVLIGLGAVFALFTGLSGCDSDSSNPPVDGGEDGSDLDGGKDGGPISGGPTRLSVTSGGGTAESDGYKVRVNVGAPQPYGSASGPGGSVEVGPGAKP